LTAVTVETRELPDNVTGMLISP